MTQGLTPKWKIYGAHPRATQRIQVPHACGLGNLSLQKGVIGPSGTLKNTTSLTPTHIHTHTQTRTHTHTYTSADLTNGHWMQMESWAQLSKEPNNPTPHLLFPIWWQKQMDPSNRSSAEPILDCRSPRLRWPGRLLPAPLAQRQRLGTKSQYCPTALSREMGSTMFYGLHHGTVSSLGFHHPGFLAGSFHGKQISPDRALIEGSDGTSL